MKRCFVNNLILAGVFLLFFLVLPVHAQHHYFAPPTTSPAPQLDLPRAMLKLGAKTVKVQIASTIEQRQKGLMHRDNMPDKEGMLFVFEKPETQCFWMKNTTLPLTAAFIKADGSIVNLADMQPLDETSKCSKEPVLYVLEMNQGFFERNRITAKMKVTLSSDKPLSTLKLKTR